MSTKRGSCLHSPAMTRAKIISHVLGTKAWRSTLPGVNLGMGDGQLVPEARLGPRKAGCGVEGDRPNIPNPRPLNLVKFCN